MRRNRWSIVVVLLAVACCADRAVLAAPALPPQAAQLAQRVVSRLTVRFCRTVITLRLVNTRAMIAGETAERPLVLKSLPQRARLTFAQLSLPPPAL